MTHQKWFALVVVIVALAISGIGTYVHYTTPWSPASRVYAWTQLKLHLAKTNEDARRDAMLTIEKTYDLSDSVLAEELSKLYLTVTTTTTGTQEKSISSTTTQQSDPNYLVNAHYHFPTGSDGSLRIATKQVRVENYLIGTYDVTDAILQQAVNGVEFTGAKPTAEITKELSARWSQIVTAVSKTSPQTTSIVPYLTADEALLLPNLIKIQDIAYRLQATPKVTISPGQETETNIPVGTIALTQKGCSVTGTIPIIYDKAAKNYQFSNVYAAISSLCNKPKTTAASSSSGSTLTCTNCWLAPVSKQYALPNGYAPYVVATGLNGGGQVTPDTKTALTKLFADLKAAGIYVRVSSAYRSYQTQVTLFNSYVTNEMASGKLTRAQAIEKANTYSAKPGHSEHQLGTTTDIVSCKTSCSFDDPANTKLYAFLNQNAYKYGFIISYPNGSQPYTGYVYEPWHIRYIGVTLATQLYNKGYLSKKGYYLYQFLLEKGQY